MKKNLIKIGLFIFLFIGAETFAQTPITLYSCDTIIASPSMNLPSGNYLLTIKSPTHSRLAFNVEYFDSNYGNVNIYNGSSSNAPLMTTLGDIFSLPNQLYGGQTTDSAITFLFYSPSVGSPQKFKILIRCVDTPRNIPEFQTLNGLGAGGIIQSTDYDNDGDKDLLIGGRIFRNDSYYDSVYLFDRLINPISGWTNTKITAADFNNDGLKDLFITGRSSVFGGIVQSTAGIYKNIGNGQFSLVTSTNFTGAERGACSVVDYNNDGKPDISYTGATSFYLNTDRLFKVYINNGNFSFTDANISLPGISGLVNSSISWSDYDADGDKDLLLNGSDGNSCFAKLFRRSGNTFTELLIGMSGTSSGEISWQDVNMDGRPDIVNRGVATFGNLNAINPEIWMNGGNSLFAMQNNNLPSLSSGSIDWYDYDGDMDLDAVICGNIDSSSGIYSQAALYKNNGNGQFLQIGLDGFVGDSRIKWVDFNRDGKADIVGAGSDIEGKGGYMIKNMGNDSFKISSYPFTVNQYYASNIVVEDFNQDGNIDILTIGPLCDVDCNSNNSSTLVLGKNWQLQGVPKFSRIADLYELNNREPDYFWSWADFNSDGLTDVIASYEPYNPYINSSQHLRMFKNEGNNSFSLAFNSDDTPLEGHCYKQAIIFDIDNDGINELFTPCYNTVFKWMNNHWVLHYSNYISSNGLIPGSVTIGDYNNDGFIDLAASYRNLTTGGGTGNSYIKFFKNNGQGRMVIDDINNNSFVSERQIKFCDIDNDGDLDLIFGNGAIENRSGVFVGINNQLTSTVTLSTGDFNNDGFTDFVRTYKNEYYGSVKIAYNEQGSMFFYQKEHGMPTNSTGTIWNESSDAFDVDLDGDVDIIYSMSLCNGGTSILLNKNNTTIRSLHLIKPNGAEQFQRGTIQNIRWFGNQIGRSVKIEFSTDSGVTWQTISNSQYSSSLGGSFQWTVAGQTSHQCLIRITDNSNNIYKDTSDATFSITDAPLIVEAGNDTTICQGSQIQLGAPAVNGNIYNWHSDPPGFTSITANPIVSPSVDTRYYLSVSNGTYTASDSILIAVDTCNVLLPISVYPNPANTAITINLRSTVLPVHFNLYNSSGLVVISNFLNNSINNVNVTLLSPGMYYYNIYSSNGQLLNSGSIIIIH
jgi:hypothetical protein